MVADDIGALYNVDDFFEETFPLFIQLSKDVEEGVVMGDTLSLMVYFRGVASVFALQKSDLSFTPDDVDVSLQATLERLKSLQRHIQFFYIVLRVSFITRLEEKLLSTIFEKQPEFEKNLLNLLRKLPEK